MTSVKRGLFLDRDGVINIDHHYVHRCDQFDIIEGVVEALQRAQDAKFLLIVVTNQSGIARGYFTQEEYFTLEAHMERVFAAQGVRFTDIYHCPHHPDGQVAELSVDCSCRKPAPGMILRAAKKHGIDLASSVLVGDKESDIAAARAAGVGRSYLLDPPNFMLKDVLLDRP